MYFIADFHLHSYYSRATSKDCCPEQLGQWARLKGVQVIGTGDFTHPGWIKELKTKLTPAAQEEGLYQLKPEYSAPSSVRQALVAGGAADAGQVRFVLSAEISSIYKKSGRVRKIHNLVLVPDMASAERINAALARFGNLSSDGRPILGLDSRRVLEICLECCPQVIFIPAHIWTPHFSLFGSQSGFDHLTECFEDLSEHIFALETGLSSDPAMNFRLSALDGYTLVSNSDAHSPKNLAREANCFDTELSYPAIRQALKTKDLQTFRGTIEFYPQEGKYYYDGHRLCQVCWSPEQTLAAGGVCPRCGRKVTIGVMHRVVELADRPVGGRPKLPTPAWESLIPLSQILAELYQVGEGSKKVEQAYFQLLASLGDELSILRTIPLEEIQARSNPLLAEGIRRAREGRVNIRPGFDGEYGKVQLFDDQDRQKFKAQMSLFGIMDLPSGNRKEAAEENRPGGEKKVGSLTYPTSSASSERMRGAFGKEEPQARASQRQLSGRLEIPPLATQSQQGAEPKQPPPSFAFFHTLPSPWFLQLNEEQRQCVTSDRGPIIIIAGPGTGKTRTLACRIAYLIHQQHIPPSRILAITFTNKAAQELASRIRQILSPSEMEAEDSLLSGTFHQLCLTILQEVSESGYHSSAPAGKILPVKTLLNEQDALLLVKEAVEIARCASSSFSALGRGGAVSGRVTNPLSRLLSQPQRIYQWISKIKSRSWGLDLLQAGYLLKPLDSPPPPPPPAWMKEAVLELSGPLDLTADDLWLCCLAYQNLLYRYQAYDYDDLLLAVVRLFQSEPNILHNYQSRFLQVLVDEFQDVNEIQYLLVKLLAGQNGSGLLVIGDPDQAIYAFRGADYRFFFQLQEDFPSHRLFRLTENYRSQGYILQAASALIRHNPDRMELELKPARSQEKSLFRGNRTIKLHLVSSEQAEGIGIVRQITRMMGGIDMLGAHGQGESENQLRLWPGQGEPRLAEERAELGFSDFAVLIRAGRQAGPLETCFLRAGIPYRVVGQKGFLQNPAVQTTVALLRFLANAEDDFTMMNLLYHWEKSHWSIGGSGPLVRQRLQQLASQRPCSLFQAIRYALHEQTASPDELPALVKNRLQALLSLWEGHHLRIYEPADQLIFDLIRWQEEERARSETRWRVGSDQKGEDQASSLFEDLDRLYQCSKQFSSAVEFLKSLLLFRDGDLEYQGKNTSRQEAVSLMTIHAAKGLEFPVVFICGLEEGLLPYRHYDWINEQAKYSNPTSAQLSPEESWQRPEDQRQRQEERRLFYVAITRAKDELIFFSARRRRHNQQVISTQLSSFLAEIPDHLLSEVSSSPAIKSRQLRLF